MVKKNKEHKLGEEKKKYNPVFDTLVYAILIGVAVITVLPVLYVVAVSITPYDELARNQGVVLFPKEVTFEAYKTIFARPDF